VRTLVSMSVSYQWPPDWWRRVTWPEFKVMVRMRNEYDEFEARRQEREEGGMETDDRLGKPPSERELAVLPKAS
jgi:hypothetical protein